MKPITVYTGRVKQTLPVAMNRLKEAYHKSNNCFFIVPEQYTLQAEQDILHHLALPGFFSIQVLSPSRLRYRIFEQVGQDAQTPIDPVGKKIAIQQALLKAKSKLQYYGQVADSPGFSEKILQEILS
ncbi:MAG: hypothetical protein GX786_08515, partial [Clostridiales bacterium]|nr:hypothetical protein [Clostridiales bacterium]